MCETDYPHSDSTWPNCIEVVQKQIAHLTSEHAVQDPARQRRAALPVHPGRAPRARDRLTPDTRSTTMLLEQTRSRSSPVPGPASAAPRRCGSPRKARVSCAPTSTTTAPRRRCASSRQRAAPRSRSACDVTEEADVAAMVAAAVEQCGRLDIMFNNVGIPTPRLGMAFEEHTLDDFERLIAVNFRGVFLGCKHAVVQFKAPGRRWCDPQHRFGRGTRRLGRQRSTARPRARCTSSPRASRSSARADGIRVNAICPARMPYTGFMAAGGLGPPPDALEQVAQAAGAGHPLGKPITAEDCAAAAVYPVLRRPRPTSRACCFPSTAGTSPE